MPEVQNSESSIIDSTEVAAVAAGVASLSMLIALVGLVTTFFFSIKKERREAWSAQIDVEKKSLEIAELKKKASAEQRLIVLDGDA